jgi:hypothetical protein
MKKNNLSDEPRLSTSFEPMGERLDRREHTRDQAKSRAQANSFREPPAEPSMKFACDSFRWVGINE